LISLWPKGRGTSLTVLHYVKDYYRKIHSSPMPDVWRSVYDKSEHAWSQGSGGVDIPIEHLTTPGELTVLASCLGPGRRRPAGGERHYSGE
jgi:hypothetical protein